MNRGWHTPGAGPAAPGGPAQLAGGLLLPVFTIMSAVWFAAIAISAMCVWWAYEYGLPEAWLHEPWGGTWPQLPRWLALLALLVVYAVVAMPVGAARRAALHYANGGRLHGWADAWSGLLWLAVAVIALVVAWAFMPQLQDLLQDLLQELVSRRRAIHT